MGLTVCSASWSGPSGMPLRSRSSSVAISPSKVMPARYQVTPVVEPVACTIACAIVGAKAPPRIAPIAYEMETPEKRMDAGNSSA